MRIPPLLVLALLLLGFASAGTEPDAQIPRARLTPGEDVALARSLGLLDALVERPEGFDAALRTHEGATLRLDAYARVTAEAPMRVTLAAHAHGRADARWEVRGSAGLVHLAPGDAATFDVAPGEPLHVSLSVTPRDAAPTLLLLHLQNA